MADPDPVLQSRNALIAPGLLCAVLAAPVDAFTFQPSQTQYAMLPPYCQAKFADFAANRRGEWQHRFRMPEKQIKGWAQAVGSDWRHLHHYCAGRVWLSAAKDRNYLRKKRTDASGIFARAHGEIRYTWEKSRPGAPLWNRMTIDYAEAFEGMGQRKQAVDLLRGLLQKDPADADAYVALAQTLRRARKRDQALQVLRQGAKRAKEKGPVLYWLATYSYQAGDLRRARAYTKQAEAAGMNMDAMRRRLGRAAEADGAAGSAAAGD